MPLIRQKRRISWTDSRTGLSISPNFPRFVDILSLDPICGYIKCHPNNEPARQFDDCFITISLLLLFLDINYLLAFEIY